MLLAPFIAAVACILALAAGCSSSAQAGPTSTTAPRAISMPSRFCSEVRAIRALYPRAAGKEAEASPDFHSLSIAFDRLKQLSPANLSADVATVRAFLKVEETGPMPNDRAVMKYTHAALRVQAYSKLLCGVGPMPESLGHPFPGGRGWTVSF
jgi:hypothetical protein